MEKQELLKEWIKLKRKEEKYKKERQALETEIELMFPFEMEQSKIFNEDDYKVTIKKNKVYKFDQKQWEIERTVIPFELRPEKIKYELDIKGFEYLKENEKEIYRKVSNCVEIKNNKSTIKVEQKN